MSTQVTSQSKPGIDGTAVLIDDPDNELRLSPPSGTGRYHVIRPKDDYKSNPGTRSTRATKIAKALAKFTSIVMIQLGKGSMYVHFSKDTEVTDRLICDIITALRESVQAN